MINELKPFRFWCHRILPLVYDESLSYYELLCKVVDYLNKTMEDVNTLAGEVEEFEELFIQLRDFVNNYFDNLDVQNEIDHKLDEMAMDGTLTAILEPVLDDFRSEINSDILEQNLRIQTLENRMSEFTSLEEGSTTGDAELEDIRVGADGTVYDSAGDAVRGQFLELYGVVVNTFGRMNLGTLNDDHYINLNGTSSSSENWSASGFLPIKGNALMITVPEHDNATALANVASVAFYSGTQGGYIANSAEPLVEGEVGQYRLKIFPVPDGARTFRVSILDDISDVYNIVELYSIPDMIDNDDIRIITRINLSNQTAGFNASSMLIRLKRDSFLIDVTNNNRNYVNAWEATWNAYYWLMNHSNIMFATNCNYSGGTTTEEVEEHHYPLRYNGVDYPAGDGGSPRYYGTHTRPYLAFDLTNQNVKYYPMDTQLSDIPSNYTFAFACDAKLIENGQDSRATYDPYYGQTEKREPRNVFGWDDTYFYIWFCEGRNDIDGGYKKSEIVNRLLGYGVQNAVQLDGGGSTCIAANTPNTVKINAYQDAVKVRPTALNINYKYLGNNKNTMPMNVQNAIALYCANVFRPVKADMLRVLRTIYGASVGYVYHEGRGGYYKLETGTPSESLQYISFENYPITSYVAGDRLDLTGTVVVAVYSDGETEHAVDVTNDCSFTPADRAVLSTSNTTLTATYNDGVNTRTVSIPLIVS